MSISMKEDYTGLHKDSRIINKACLQNLSKRNGQNRVCQQVSIYYKILINFPMLLLPQVLFFKELLIFTEKQIFTFICMMKCWLTTMTVLATSLWTVADFSNTHLYPWKPLGSIRGSALVTNLLYKHKTKFSSW